MRTAYPGISELDLFLFSSGLITPPTGSTTRPQDVLDLGAALFAAIAEWERGTGWVPFLTEAVATTRYYDPPGAERGPVGIYQGVSNVGGGRKLFLNAGVRAITSLKVGVSPTSTGTALTVNRDYWLRPQNATAYGRPYTFVEFSSPQYGNLNSISVTAAFGFGATWDADEEEWVPSVPDDAWLAIMKMAAINVVPALELSQFAGLVSWEEGGVSEKYAAKPYEAITQSWQMQVEPVICRYRRKILA